MSDDAIDKLRKILSQAIPDEDVQAFIAELTAALGERSVAIGGNVANATIFTGNQTGATAEQIRSIIQELMSMRGLYPGLVSDGVQNTENTAEEMNFRPITLDSSTLEGINTRIEIIQEIYQSGYLPTTYQDELRNLYNRLRSFNNLNRDLQDLIGQSDRLIESAVKAMNLQLDAFRLASEKITESVRNQEYESELECQQEMAQIFQAFINRLEDSRNGADWINRNKRMLIDRASSEIFKQFPTPDLSEQIVDDFKFSLGQFLEQVVSCLYLGSHAILDSPNIPLVLEIEQYEAAFQFMKSSVPERLRNETIHEINECFDYLIGCLQACPQ
jgi:hypothetical protein